MREISVRIFDDLDFTGDGKRNEAAVLVTVGLNGTWRELDLTEANEKYVLDILERLMAAGREPDEPPKLPEKKHGGVNKFNVDPEKLAFNERVRAWCRETGLKNSTGSGWAYQTNKTLQDYIGEPLLRKYQAYLAGQEKKGQ
jgi:Lsr2 protein